MWQVGWGQKLGQIETEKNNQNLGQIDTEQITFSQVDLKPLLNTACANIFNAYFCSVARRNYDDPILKEYCTDFDKVCFNMHLLLVVDF